MTPDTHDPDAARAFEVSRSLGGEVYCRHGKHHQCIYNCESCTAKVILEAMRAARDEGAKAEREVCALVAEKWSLGSGEGHIFGHLPGEECCADRVEDSIAATIRARGQQEAGGA